MKDPQVDLYQLYQSYHYVFDKKSPFTIRKKKEDFLLGILPYIFGMSTGAYKVVNNKAYHHRSNVMESACIDTPVIDDRKQYIIPKSDISDPFVWLNEFKETKCIYLIPYNTNIELLNISGLDMTEDNLKFLKGFVGGLMMYFIKLDLNEGGFTLKNFLHWEVDLINKGNSYDDGLSEATIMSFDSTKPPVGDFKTPDSIPGYVFGVSQFLEELYETIEQELDKVQKEGV